MLLQFWGVRGSYPTPGTTTLNVGGNTTCVSIERNGRIFVFDAGTGIIPLGKYLEDLERTRFRGSLFLSHYHWDHIQGLPFFAPAFRKENRFNLYGESKEGADLHSLLRDQMQTPYFPIDMEVQEGLVTFNPIGPDQTIEFPDNVSIRTLQLAHPNGAIGFRMDAPNSSVCIVTDHEHPADHLDQSVIEFARGANVLIHDAPYYPNEKMNEKAGWGHSSWDEAARVAAAAGVGRLFITHHDPDNDDDEVMAIGVLAREVFADAEVAVEGTIVEL